MKYTMLLGALASGARNSRREMNERLVVQPFRLRTQAESLHHNLRLGAFVLHARRGDL